MLLIALRNMIKRKGYAFIQIAGLAVSMASCSLILLWVRDEKSFDRFHENADRIFRACQVFHYDDYHLEQTQTPAVLSAKLKEDHPYRPYNKGKFVGGFGKVWWAIQDLNL